MGLLAVLVLSGRMKFFAVEVSSHSVRGLQVRWHDDPRLLGFGITDFIDISLQRSGAYLNLPHYMEIFVCKACWLLSGSFALMWQLLICICICILLERSGAYLNLLPRSSIICDLPFSSKNPFKGLLFCFRSPDKDTFTL